MARARRKQPFVITVLAVGSLGAVACGGSTANDSGLGGNAGTGGSGNFSGSGGSGNVSGSGGSGGNVSGCPTSFPTNGTSCPLPDGTTCYYDQGSCCPDWGATCEDGVWQAFASSCNPPPPPPCPAELPQDGSDCSNGDPCGAYYNYCTYDICVDGTASTVAECDGVSWKVTQQQPCTLPACETLSACECFDRPDCGAISEGCLCQCDFNCPGDPPCECDCGGGKFLGCASTLLD